MGRMVVGLVADPGLCTNIAKGLASDLPAALNEVIDHGTQWHVEVVSEALPLDADGKVQVWKNSSRLKADKDWDFLVCLTELTRRRDEQLVVSDVNTSHGAALISLPALGPVGLRHEVKAAVTRVIDVMTNPDGRANDRTPALPPQSTLSKLVLGPMRREETHDSAGTDSFFELSAHRGRLRLLLGMVRVNRPWRLVPSLSSAIAAAVATAAFGVFYSSIWKMADALSLPRLILISFAAVIAMAAWLVLYNGLWEGKDELDQRKDLWLYDGSTVVTVATGVLIMYVLLVLLMVFGALIVIPPHYLASRLGHPAVWTDFVQLSWLASSLGTFAGALGSSFQSDDAIRDATYGKREQERQARRSK